MEKILLVNDSPSVNLMLKSRLESSGFSVDTVETGEEGIEKARGLKYKLILLDYTLSGMNGAEVCRILKAEKGTKNTTIVLISARDESEIREISRDAGADGFIAISSEGEGLVEEIKSFMKRR